MHLDTEVAVDITAGGRDGFEMSTVTTPELSAANMTADAATCTTSHTGALTLGEN